MEYYNYKFYMLSKYLDKKWKVILCIYIGTLCYTIASYFHLKLDPWTFKSAYLIAIPVVLVEYFFSLQGNHAAHTKLKMNVSQILIITICCAYVNGWLLNYFVLNNQIIWWREILSFMFISAGYYTSTNIGTTHS